MSGINPRRTSLSSFQSAAGFSESSPLISQPAVASGNYYFLQNAESQFGRKDYGCTAANGNMVDIIPRGAEGRAFSSIPVVGGGRGDLEILNSPPITSKIESLHEQQHCAAIKIEPKIFFSNERTFLAWIHTSVLLAGASIALSSFSQDTLSHQLYGVIMLSISITFICYAMYQYSRRARMICKRSPGPYEAIIGPCVLGIILILSIVAQFVIQISSVV
eukprot:CAMPEP_0198264254 /NCGR_PEP_ID=MMETSP1447-20131203/14978_1 /TAXON_ID=420782 /ORGANISM="Chaetoceros dichaeta, Strain CCMP1751" /LENGTH=218 /DNA_ID=CAMNT_0043953127 /DNA_START=33 /DNA_END=689 /DNA_ORIENTATION=+